MKVLLTLYGEERGAEEFSHTATTIRVGAGNRDVTDGPFIETKEQLGGFIVLEVRDLDEALEWAAKTPWNHDCCSTEIRPVMNYDAWMEASGAAGERASS